MKLIPIFIKLSNDFFKVWTPRVLFYRPTLKQQFWQKLKIIICQHGSDLVIPESITPRVSSVSCRGCRWIHAAQRSCETFQVSARNCAAAALTQSREKLRPADPNTSGRRAAGLQQSLTSLWLLGFQLLLVNGGRREIQISCVFQWELSGRARFSHRFLRVCVFFFSFLFHKATWRLWLPFCPHAAQVRASGDASICLSIRMFCHFPSTDVKAIPAAFIETTSSITVTAKRIKQKMSAPPPPPPFKMPKRADPQENPPETRGVNSLK